jgi:hypothetical protein
MIPELQLVWQTHMFPDCLYTLSDFDLQVMVYSGLDNIWGLAVFNSAKSIFSFIRTSSVTGHFMLHNKVLWLNGKKESR